MKEFFLKPWAAGLAGPTAGLAKTTEKTFPLRHFAGPRPSFRKWGFPPFFGKFPFLPFREGGALFQPLTEPIWMPSISCFWKMKKTMAQGISMYMPVAIRMLGKVPTTVTLPSGSYIVGV